MVYYVCVCVPLHMYACVYVYICVYVHVYTCVLFHCLSFWPKDTLLQWVLALSILQFSAKASQMMKQERQVQSLSREDPLEEEMTTHCSILAWEIPWTEEPGWLQSTALQRVGHENPWAAKQTHILPFWAPGQP